VVDQRLSEAGVGHDLILTRLMEALKPSLMQCSESFLNEQIAGILNQSYSCKKRLGIFPIVQALPLFVKHFEGFCTSMDRHSNTRQLLDLAYDRMCTSIFKVFTDLSSQGEKEDDQEDEDKGRLNAVVMLLENLAFLARELQRCPKAIHFMLQPIQTSFTNHLSLYARLSSPRVLGKVHEFGESVALNLKSVGPSELANYTHFSRTTAKSVLAALTLKELRKSVEALNKRVQKHFVTEPSVMHSVWKSIREDQVQRWQALDKNLRCVYGEGVREMSDVRIEDMEAIFREFAKF
jgi:exocyst complex component 1